LFKRKEHHVKNKLAKSIVQKYRETYSTGYVGSKSKNEKKLPGGRSKRNTRKAGALVQIGLLPINIDLNDLVM